MVVLFHLHTVGGVGFGFLDPIIRGANTGVYVFFSLSGYLLYRPFVGREPSLLSYGIKRAARILPGYFVALLCLMVLTGNTLPLAHPIPYLTVASSYSVPLRAFLGSAWTLSAEILFYLTLPLIARAARGRHVLVLGGLGAASALGAVAFALLLTGDAQVWLATYPLVFYAFVPGMLLAVLEQSRPALFRRLATWPWLLLGGLYLVLGALFADLPFEFAPVIGSALVMGWLLQHQPPGGRTLAFLGGMSYAAYLWHKDLIIAFGPGGALLALVGAALSWAVIERPILNWAHGLARRPAVAREQEQPAPVSGA